MNLKFGALILLVGVCIGAAGLHLFSGSAGTGMRRQAERETSNDLNVSRLSIEEEVSRIKLLEDLERQKIELQKLFGKILKLILADLGIQLADAQDVGISVCIPDNNDSAMNGPQTSDQQNMDSKKAMAEKMDRARRKKLEYKITTDGVADSSTNEELRLQDPDRALFESRPIRDMKRYGEISGRYEGRIRQSNGNTEWFAELSFGEKKESGGDRKKGMHTVYELKIYASEKDEKPFSHKSGDSRGGIPSIRSLSGETEALIFKASPTMFLQLYYNPIRRALTGSLYRNDSSSSDYQFYGTVDLVRVTGE